MALRAAHKVLVGIVWWVMAQSNMGILMHPHAPAAHDLVAGQSAGSLRESGSVLNKHTTDDSSRVASSKICHKAHFHQPVPAGCKNALFSSSFCIGPVPDNPRFLLDQSELMMGVIGANRIGLFPEMSRWKT